MGKKFAIKSEDITNPTHAGFLGGLISQGVLDNQNNLGINRSTKDDGFDGLHTFINDHHPQFMYLKNGNALEEITKGREDNYNFDSKGDDLKFVIREMEIPIGLAHALAKGYTQDMLTLGYTWIMGPFKIANDDDFEIQISPQKKRIILDSNSHDIVMVYDNFLIKYGPNNLDIIPANLEVVIKKDEHSNFKFDSIKTTNKLIYNNYKETDPVRFENSIIRSIDIIQKINIDIEEDNNKGLDKSIIKKHVLDSLKRSLDARIDLIDLVNEYNKVIESDAYKKTLGEHTGNISKGINYFSKSRMNTASQDKYLNIVRDKALALISELVKNIEMKNLSDSDKKVLVELHDQHSTFSKGLRGILSCLNHSHLLFMFGMPDTSSKNISKNQPE